MGYPVSHVLMRLVSLNHPVWHNYANYVGQVLIAVGALEQVTQSDGPSTRVHQARLAENFVALSPTRCCVAVFKNFAQV